MSNLELAFESGEASLSPRRFRVEEHLSQLFQITVMARSPSEELDLDALVGRPAVFRIQSGAVGLTQKNRAWTGVVSRMEMSRVEDSELGLSTYELTLVPALWMLTQRRNNRLFQHLPIPDIVSRLLDEWRIAHDWVVSRERYLPVELRIQWDESDFAFLSRLLEIGRASCRERVFLRV